MEKLDGKGAYFDIERSGFASALWLDNIFPKKLRRAIAKFLDILLILSLGAIFMLIVGLSGGHTAVKGKLIDFIFLVLAFRLIIFCLESFYLSKSTDEPPKESRNIADCLSFEAASLFAKTLFRNKFISGPNILYAFSKTGVGIFAFSHLGVDVGEFRAGLSRIPEAATASPADFFPPPEKIQESRLKNKNTIGLNDIIPDILEKDENVSRLFFERKIRKEDVRGALEWAGAVFDKKEKESRWWLEDNLARIRGIGKDWAYGATYLLDRYSRSFKSNHPVTEQRLSHFLGHQKQTGAIESVLSRSSQANVLIVGEPGTGKRTTIAGLDNMIGDGRARPELEYKRIMELDAPSLVASAKTKGELENLIIRIFNDAAKAGNIILVIDNFADFLNSANALGVSLVQLLNPYLQNSNLQVIAISDSGNYKRFLQPDSGLMQYFEIIRTEEPEKDELYQILEEIAMEIEQKNGLLFPYQTISEIIASSDRYVTEGALPERAIDTMEVVSARVSGAGRNVVLPQDISDFISEKIKMPLGPLKLEERERLMKLEEILHRRVVGQEEAIGAISAAVRRSRAGIGESKKPIASFLFLGPTGVGKTETAKALAEVYFGNDLAMTRFDMSEYQNENGLERLIGLFEKNEPGILAASMRDKPYGLLVLDEFEKCDQKVKDLFLQILDEGFFADAFGKKVFLRNNIIIATSNAGSRLIWEMAKKGIDPSTLKETIIDEIQKAGVFKAELLNRFDGLIIFHHLTPEHLKKIAALMLGKLKKRLKEKEIDFIINDILIEKVAEIGYDPVFGARPMQRAISDHIEKKISEWLIGGRIERGMKIEFKKEDLEEI